MAGQGLGFADRYNPLQTQSDTRTWTDLNHDNIAEDNEIGPSNNKTFGLPLLVRRPDADIGREYDWEYTAGIQHELVPGCGEQPCLTLVAIAAWISFGSVNAPRHAPQIAP